MVAPENRQFAKDYSLQAAAQEDRRLFALAELGLLEAEALPVFDEATRAAADFFETPICILGLIDRDWHWLKASVGLFDLDELSQIARKKQIPRRESFCDKVVSGGQVVAVRDTAAHPAFAQLALVQQCGIRAYLGVPLLTSSGHCVGALAVMDLAPRTFTCKQIQFLELTARWSVSEFERQRLAACLPVRGISSPPPDGATPGTSEDSHSLKQIKSELLTHLTQDLRTPLTSVMGMASVLGRGIYGPLTNKQKEYLNIIHDSGRYLLSLLDEILTLRGIDDYSPELRLAPVDIEMLCQQVLNALQHDAARREQEIRLSVEPDKRIWVLDKVKVEQMLYHLVFAVIHAATPGSVVRLHVSRKNDRLNILIWVSHPWLGEGLPLAELNSCLLPAPVASNGSAPPSDGSAPAAADAQLPAVAANGNKRGESSANAVVEREELERAAPSGRNSSRQSLGPLLSCLLAEIHGGEISIQGSQELGYRYLANLPEMAF